MDKLPRGVLPMNLTDGLVEVSAEAATDADLKLPPHFRCAAHSLNLVATTDAAEAAKRDSNYASAFEKVMSKLRALWTRQSRSIGVSDAIRKKMSRLFKVDVKTRWNSSYDALKQIKNLTDKEKTELNELMEEFDIMGAKANRNKKGPVSKTSTVRNMFSSADFKFIAEYVQVSSFSTLLHIITYLRRLKIVVFNDFHIRVSQSSECCQMSLS